MNRYPAQLVARHRNDATSHRRSWGQKFRNAFRGVKQGIRGQSSFFVHFFTAASVMAAATALKCDLFDWCALLICITIVIAGEMFNSAIEALGRAVDQGFNANLRDALDIASGAVLVTSLGAALVGALIF